MTKEEAFKWYESAIIDLKIPYVSGNDLRKKFEESWAKRNEPPSLQSQIDSLKQEVGKIKDGQKEWQLCPKCNGAGQILSWWSTTPSHLTCDLCYGTKKIKRPS